MVPDSPFLVQALGLRQGLQSYHSIDFGAGKGGKVSAQHPPSATAAWRAISMEEEGVEPSGVGFGDLAAPSSPEAG
jgi:hypothetical protein